MRRKAHPFFGEREEKLIKNSNDQYFIFNIRGTTLRWKLCLFIYKNVLFALRFSFMLRGFRIRVILLRTQASPLIKRTDWPELLLMRQGKGTILITLSYIKQFVVFLSSQRPHRKCTPKRCAVWKNKFTAPRMRRICKRTCYVGDETEKPRTACCS